jgi:molybdate-binding protein/DNA-binding PadR family transcriptional regulator
MEAGAMPVAHALLGLLARREAHGYALRRDLERELGPNWRIDFGQLYRVLARMERAGWVRVRRKVTAGGPARKVRAITAKGRRELARWTARPAGPVRRRDSTPVQRRFAAAATAGAEPALIAIGSDDAVLQLLTETLAAAHPPICFSAQSVGSLQGLNALREGHADLAGIHLLDVDSGEYNVPHVKHLVPEEAVVLLTLARREQGLLLAPGNPLQVRGARDLARPGVRVINRQRGAGTRLLLYHTLRRARVDPRAVTGYDREAPTHDAVAAAIAAGEADAGPGVRAAAEKWGLSFLPLGVERYDLAIPRAIFESPRLRPLFEVLHHRAFRQAAAAIPGYDVSRMGTVVARIQ